MSLSGVVGVVILAVVASVTQAPRTEIEQLAIAGESHSDPKDFGQPAPSLSTAQGSRWSWPFTPRPEVLQAFDAPDQPWLPGHRGVDLRADIGQPVLSPSSGVVTFSGQIAGRGVVVVRHSDGLRSTLEPVDARAPVGTAVAEGGAVGVLGNQAGHCGAASCLHWGVLRGTTYLDPLRFVRRARVILLPLG